MKARNCKTQPILKDDFYCERLNHAIWEGINDLFGRMEKKLEEAIENDINNKDTSPKGLFNTIHRTKIWQ